MKKATLSIILMFAILFLGDFSFAQTNQVSEINDSHWRILFEGKLTDATGKEVPDGKYNVKFSIFDAPQEGNIVWQEIFEKENRIEIKTGNLQAMLGLLSPLNLDFNEKDYFLSVMIGGNSEVPLWDEEMQPRRKIITLEKLLNDGSFVLSQNDLIDALIKEFESLDESHLKSSNRLNAFIEFIKNKLSAPSNSTIIVNLDTLQKIFEKAATLDNEKSTQISEEGGGFLDFIKRIINILIEKISLIFEKIGQIFTSLMNISDKIDKIYEIVSKSDLNFLPSQEQTLFQTENFLFKSPTQSFGSAVITKGANSIFVLEPQIKKTSKIFITFKKSPAFVWWISEKIEGKGFSIALYPQSLEDIEFDWWVVNDLNFKESPLPSPTALPQNQNQNNEQTQSPLNSQTSATETPQIQLQEQQIEIAPESSLNENLEQQEQNQQAIQKTQE